MRVPRIGIVFGAALAIAACAGGDSRERGTSADPTSRRVTRTGTVVGFVGQYGSHVWLGIPFAQPPIGPLRWRAPQVPAPWQGRREALAFGSGCVQYGSPFAGIAGAKPDQPAGNEDCLYLNVYAPRVAAADVPGGARWPVMVWIHGGGNTIGEAGYYNGGNLAQIQRVVVVTVNYRLGPFGWFRHAALRGDGTNDLDRSGNFGTLDLVHALEWVQDNIAAFGGDPGRVTIFGESAGGTNVFSLLLSPVARGLFHRAIIQSGGLRLSELPAAEHFTTDAEPGDANSSSEALVQLLIADGRARDHATGQAAAAAMSGAEVERYLRAKTSAQILAAYTPMPGTGLIRMPVLFREGMVLPQEDPMLQLARPDGYHHVPVMLGTNKDENKLFMFGDPARVRRILWIIPRLRDARGYQLSAEYLAKMWKATGADQPAAAMRAVQGASVFVYRFDWDEEPRLLGAELSVMLGAAHAFEIPFVFGHFDLGRQANVIFDKENEAGRRALSAQMMSYWAELAYNGAPGRGRDGTLPAWSAWDASAAASPKFLVLDTPGDGGVRMAAEALTTADVLAAVDDDPRLTSQRDKCRIYRELAEWARGFTKKEYARAGKRGCAEYPFDDYPWEG